MNHKINMARAKLASAALGVLVVSSSGAFAQYDARQAQHSANVRAIQAQRDQHAANVAALHGDYEAADAYARAARVRRVQSYRDADYADHLRHRGYGYWGY